MKYKSYGFWTSLAASAVVMAGMLQKAFGFDINSEILTDIIMGLAGVLVVFGVVKMPKTKKEEAPLQNVDEEKIEEDLNLETEKFQEIKPEDTKLEDKETKTTQK